MLRFAFSFGGCIGAAKRLPTASSSRAARRLLILRRATLFKAWLEAFQQRLTAPSWTLTSIKYDPGKPVDNERCSSVAMTGGFRPPPDRQEANRCASNFSSRSAAAKNNRDRQVGSERKEKAIPAQVASFGLRAIPPGNQALGSELQD